MPELALALEREQEVRMRRRKPAVVVVAAEAVVVGQVAGIAVEIEAVGQGKAAVEGSSPEAVPQVGEQAVARTAAVEASEQLHSSVAVEEAVDIHKEQREQREQRK